MKLIYSDDHRDHAGAKEMRYDEMIPMSESPERMDMIMEALVNAGHNDVVVPKSFSLEAVYKVHDPAFVSFLERAYPLWEAEFGPGGYATAYTFGMRGMAQAPNQSIHSMLSCYTFDVCVPIVEGTWKAIRSAVDVALTGVDIIQGGEKAVFSLCRPPGHHASGDLAGGYCYLNNAAIAAQAHLDGGARRVAILDIDYHHGNGSQHIFYEREDVFFASLHARPEDEYPFLMGYATEVGKGDGKGYNLNLPMPKGTDFSSYVLALQVALRRIEHYAPDVLVISLGVDTFVDDPVGGFELQSPDYSVIGQMIAQLSLPTHFIMEGGYAMEALGTNVANVISGYCQDG
ncbi:histone deacetylase family protein [Kiloniella antarctica]|uniref:Histone deacetylase family protein n=1 Tax=Kiloniella antarctica TaxID=1550907 RepID=A0ABW5BLV7_9PROT